VNILVCLKQVPDTETIIKIAGDGKSIVTDDVKWVMNPYDEFGVEEALKIKEKAGGEVIVASVGPARTTEALRTALAMGADKAVQVTDDAAEGADALGVAKILAKVIGEVNPDLVFCGQRGVDHDVGATGTILADLMGWPHVAIVTKVDVTDGQVVCSRPIEGGTVVLEAKLPAILTTQKGLNEPRYASLPGIMKAKKKPLETKSLADLGLSGDDVAAQIEVLAMTPPPERAAGKLIDGETAEDKANNLAAALSGEAKVI
jgi:electron transfer flavoprotein beta subunit